MSGNGKVSAPRSGKLSRKLLDGVRIIDFTHMVAGPLSTMILADMGADVIKVEPPEGETSRHLGDPVFGDQTDYFLSFNRNKRSIVLDLKSEDGVQTARNLIATADVVVENFRTGKADEMGIGYDAMSALNPSLIYCSVSGYGSQSRLRDKPALDPLVQGLSGLMTLTGTPETGPLKTGFLIGDFVAPLFGAIGLLAALYERRASGKGQFLDVAMLNSLIFTMIPREGKFLAKGAAPRLVGNGHNQLAPANSYPTADGRQVVVFCHIPKYWRMLARMLGREDLIDDPRFQSNRDRVANKAALDELLSEAFRERPLAYWLERIDEEGVTAGPVRTFEEVFADEEVQCNMLACVERAGVGSARVLRTPIGFSRTPLEVRSAPPELGEHTEEILAELRAHGRQQAWGAPCGRRLNMSGYGTVDYLASNGRAYVTLNRPDKRNAMCESMWDQLMDCYHKAEADDDVRVVILRSEGEDFCAGHDLFEVGNQYGEAANGGNRRRPSQRARLKYDKIYVERLQRIFNSLKPTITLVKGYCLGGGLYMAEASDLVIAADSAQLGHPEQKLGLAGAAYFDAWEIMTLGARKARELLLLGEIWTAQEALANGLVNKVVQLADLHDQGEAWAEKIVRQPRDGIAMGKAATGIALQSLGVSSQFAYGHVLHTLATNVRYEPGEFNFMKERRDKGVRVSHHDREEFYGAAGERKD